MSNAANVSTGKPKVGGAIFSGPVGTTLPTTAVATLDNALKQLGYASADGLRNNNERAMDAIKAWGGDTVYSAMTAHNDTFTVTLIEALNTDVLAGVFGSQNVSGSLTAGVAVKVNADDTPEAAWVFDMILRGGYLRRIVIPHGKITSVGEVTYTDNAAIGYALTITAMPDANGQTHYEYTSAPAA